MILLMTSLSVFASPAGKIAGRVYDASTRTHLVGANVVVLDTDLGGAADPAGTFIIRDVPAGTYSVEVSMIGYRTQVKTSVVVEPGRSTELVFKLSPSAVQMAGITVRPDYFPKVKDAPVSERSFSAAEIEGQPGGSGDISRVVQAMPAVVSSGDQSNEIIVRGGNPNENLFLIDGIEIPYPNHFNMFTEQGGPINLLNPLLIREMDFIAGALPARFGGRASSVMDISLKRGSKNEFAGNVDNGMAGLGVVLEGPLPWRVGSFLTSYHKSMLGLLAESGIWGMSAVPYYDNYFGKINIDISNSNELSLLAVYGDDHIYIGEGEGIANGDDSARGVALLSKTSRLATGIGWQTLFGEAGFGKLLLFGASTHWDFHQTWADDVSDTTISFLNTEQSWGGRYDATLRWLETQETQAGVIASWVPFSYELFSASDTVFYYPDPDDTTNRIPLIDSTTGEALVYGTDVESDAAGSKLGGYVQHRIGLGNFAHLSVGARADYFSYTDKFYVSPRIGLSTEPLLAGFSFNAGYGWHYQPPAYYILVADSAANHNLESRRSDHYVVGIERLLADDIKLSVEGYYKEIHNVPIPEHWSTTDPYDYSGVYVDNGQATATGLELFLQKKYANNWYGTLAYSFSDSRMTNPQDSTKTIPGDYDYRHVFTAMSGYKLEFHRYDWYKKMPGWLKYTVGSIFLSDEADLGFRFRYMGGRPYTPKEWMSETRRWVDNGDLLNSERYPAYHRLDLRWDHKFIFERWSLAWYFELQNVYDRRNVWWYWYAEDGSIDTVHQFRFFPMGGLAIEF